MVPTTPAFGVNAIAINEIANSDKIVWGLRRSLRLDWPFDSDERFIERLRRVGYTLNDYVDKFNYMIENIERVITR